jgi:putative flippase GtrA
MSPTDVVILIPAYQPDRRLVDLVRSLQATGTPVVVVDDGSDAECAAVFAAVRQMAHSTVLRHSANQGKGAALKTGLEHIANHFPDHAGAVTADADGQHRVEDVLAVADALRTHPKCLILGARGFEGRLPFRSRLGNTATRAMLRLVMGQSISDTQTGLRGIPNTLFPRLLVISHQGYEFELEMLLVCKYEGIQIREVRIQTIYIDENRSSHFNPLLDSFRIYFVLLRFALVSLCSAIVDNLIFACVYFFWPSILGSQILGRIAGTLFNYLGNKTTVFRSRERVSRSLPKYLLLVLISGTLSYGMIRLLVARLGMDVYLAKLLAESLLFFVNFFVQRQLVFPRPRNG